MREQLASIWKNLEEYICCALLGVIMTLLMMQVCYRYFGGKSIAWSEEVSRFLFLYLVYFAASLAASKNLHIRVTAQLKLLPKLGQMLLLPYDGHHLAGLLHYRGERRDGLHHQHERPPDGFRGADA